MKIIARKESGNFICEMEENELANLLGFYSKYQADKNCFDEGKEIAVSSLYHDKSELEEMLRKIKEFHGFFIECAEFYNKINISKGG